MSKRLSEWMESSWLIFTGTAFTAYFVINKIFHYCVFSSERSRNGTIRSCRAGCVNIGVPNGSSGSFSGSGFLIQGKEIDELRERLKTKYEEYHTGKQSFYTSFEYLIITNHHVIKAITKYEKEEYEKEKEFMLPGTKCIRISPAEVSNINNKQAIFDAKIIQVDKQCDLALLTMVFANATDEDFAPDLAGFTKGLHFDPIEPELLDTVYAFGCPKSYESSVTKGIISHTNRIIQSQRHYQTDAAINQGNSGGPLINDWAFVVGVATQKVDDANTENISFAIPAVEVKKFLTNVVPEENQYDAIDGIEDQRVLDIFNRNDKKELKTKLDINDEETLGNLIEWYKIETVYFLPQSKLKHYNYKGMEYFKKQSPDIKKGDPLKKQPEFVAAYEVLDMNDGNFHPISENSKDDNTLRCFTERSIEDLERKQKFIVTASKK